LTEIISKCRKCGKFIPLTKDGYCQECYAQVEEEFKRVRAYLKANPDATIPETSEKTGVSEKRILRFIREDRLETVSHAQFTVQCEMCHARIPSGRYCAKCSATLLQALDKTLPKQRQKQQSNDQPRAQDSAPRNKEKMKMYLDRDIHCNY